MSWLGITASGAGATAACPPRAALPQAKLAAGERADRGNHLHSFCRVTTVNPGARAQALLDVPEEYRHTAEGIDLQNALAGLRIVGCERAYALNVKTRTTRFIGEDIERKYEETLAANGQPPLDRYEIPFTVDLEAFYDGTEPSVPAELDYKSGKSIGDPAEHWQRRICAIGLMFFHDSATAISRVAYINDDGSIFPDGHEFSILDADDYCDVLVKMIDAVVSAKATIAEGKIPTVYPDRENQCQYCDAFVYCPYWNALIHGAKDGLSAVTKGQEVGSLSLNERGQILDYVKDVLKVATALEDQLREMVLKQPLPIDDEYEFRNKPKKGRSYFDAAEARGLITILLGRLGSDEQEIATKLAKLTKSGKDQDDVRKRKRDLPILKVAS